MSFTEAVAKAGDGRFRVVIRFREGNRESESVFAQDPPRQVMVHPTGRMIWTGETSIICTEGEAAPAGPECTELGSFDLGIASFGFEATFGGLMVAHRSIVESADTLAGWDEEHTTINGRAAVCAVFDDVPIADFPLGGAARICADAELGVIVLMESLDDSGVGTRWEAAEVGEPRAEDFEPPVEPTKLTIPDIPDMPEVETPDITIPDF
ncbi:MAG TPA: hypothetical protein VM618_08310 [Acidimicrobiia bacterium]|nr:hypothetical protein [Acidimicrobiia bacterium]